MEKTWDAVITKPKQGMQFRLIIIKLVNVPVYFREDE